MGMKANSNLFVGTSGLMRFKLDIQFFASKAFSKKGTVTTISLEKHGQDFLNKTPEQVEKIMQSAGYETHIRASKFGTSNTEVIVAKNPSRERNVTQIQVSSKGSGHHGSLPYVKVSTKDIGIIKIINGEKSEYRTDGKEKAKLVFKSGGKKK